MRTSSYGNEGGSAKANIEASGPASSNRNVPHGPIKRFGFKIGLGGVEWFSHWKPGWPDVVLVAIVILGACWIIRGCERPGDSPQLESQQAVDPDLAAGWSESSRDFRFQAEAPAEHSR